MSSSTQQKKCDGARVNVLVGAALFILLLQQGCENTDDHLLECDSPVFDIGVTNHASFSHDFRLTNRSQSRIKISGIERSCTCLSPDISNAELGPNQEAIIKMRAETPVDPIWKRVPFTHTLTIFSDPPQANPVVLVARGIYIPPICLDVDSLVIDVSNGNIVERDFDVYMAPGIEIARLVSNLDWLSASADIAGGPDRNGITRARVSLSGNLPNGVSLPFQGSIKITPSNDPARSIDVPLVLVPGEYVDLEKHPDRLAFGVAAVGESSTTQLIAHWPTSSGMRLERISFNHPVTVAHTLQETDGLGWRRNAGHSLCLISVATLKRKGVCNGQKGNEQEASYASAI